MNKFETFNRLYDEALEAKKNYDIAILRLRAAGSASKPLRIEITERVKAEHPEIVASMDEAYANGERIKDAMYKGERWPKAGVKGRTRYFQMLEDVPIDQRSEEMTECLKWWLQFEEGARTIERLYPAPKHFYWNGCQLSGPNLYADFGLTTQMD